jgi:hypothetical protein
MQVKRRVWLSAVAVVLMVALALAMGGCESKEKTEEALRSAVDATFAQVMPPTDEVATQLLGEETLERLGVYGVAPTDFLTHVLAHLSYSIDEVTVEEDEAQIAVTVNNACFEDAKVAALKDFDKWIDTDEALSVYKESEEAGLYGKLFSLIYERIDAGESVATQVNMTAEKQDDGTWSVTPLTDEALQSALFGGVALEV